MVGSGSAGLDARLLYETGDQTPLSTPRSDGPMHTQYLGNDGLKNRLGQKYKDRPSHIGTVLA